MDALGQLAAGIAHDFNNVLTVVGTAAQSIEAWPALPDDLAEDVRAIREETARGAALASQLLAYSRHQTLPPESLSLNDVVHSIAFALRRVIPPRIEVIEELEAGPAIVSMHRSQADQILMNLVLNARDAISGNGTITIATEYAGSGTVLLRVADTGSGMHEEVRRRSLEPFFSTKPAGKGTGLGLSTVNTIVKNAGGQVTVESVPGKGTTVSVRLPAIAQVTAPQSE
jgi:two-component system cell cycle sensor histidine kinase/response regulator CckA